MGMWAFYSQLKNNKLFCIILYCLLEEEVEDQFSLNLQITAHWSLQDADGAFEGNCYECTLQFLVFHSWKNEFQVFTLYMWTVILEDGPCSYLLDPVLHTMCSRCPQAHKGIQGQYELKARHPHWRHKNMNMKQCKSSALCTETDHWQGIWMESVNKHFLPKFIVSIKALRLDIVNCK